MPSFSKHLIFILSFSVQHWLTLGPPAPLPQHFAQLQKLLRDWRRVTGDGVLDLDPAWQSARVIVIQLVSVYIWFGKSLKSLSSSCLPLSPPFLIIGLYISIKRGYNRGLFLGTLGQYFMKYYFVFYKHIYLIFSELYTEMVSLLCKCIQSNHW